MNKIKKISDIISELKIYSDKYGDRLLDINDLNRIVFKVLAKLTTEPPKEIFYYRDSSGNIIECCQNCDLEGNGSGLICENCFNNDSFRKKT